MNSTHSQDNLDQGIGSNSGTNNACLIDIQNLSVSFNSKYGNVEALSNISLQLHQGEALGLVGESGSGKSTLAFAITRLLAANGKVTFGQILFEGKNLMTLDTEAIRKIRGKDIAMVFQDPLSSLTPTQTIGQNLVETLLAHENVSRNIAIKRSNDILDRVGIPAKRFNNYPHQFSGGMRQRVSIATALICNPKLVILDEPTSALDVTLQISILNLLKELKNDYGLTILFISHDLRIVAEICETISVMYAGHIVETGPLYQVINHSLHGYTRGLIASIPRSDHIQRRPISNIPGRLPSPGEKIPGCNFSPRCAYFDKTQGCLDNQTLGMVKFNHLTSCIRHEFVSKISWLELVPPTFIYERSSNGETILEIRNITKTFGKIMNPSLFSNRLGHQSENAIYAVNNVTLDVKKGETLGIVGESGSGKTTLARIIVRLTEPTSGTIVFKGANILHLKGRELKAYHRATQIIFQNPDSSLNPRRRIGDILSRNVEIGGDQNKRDQQDRVIDLLNMVHLPKEYISRYPHELSGGEKQRIGIARALALNPEIIVCDEPVSALDVSVTSAILNLLVELQAQFGLTFIFISHDLSVVQHLSDRIAVMHNGYICEFGDSKNIFQSPTHAYTKRLLASVPSRLHGFVNSM